MLTTVTRGIACLVFFLIVHVIVIDNYKYFQTLIHLRFL